MPKEMMSDDMMDEDRLYGASPGAETEPAAEESAESVDQEEAEGAEQTAVISNKILSPEGEPLKAGDEVVLQVVKNYGEESEVRYAPKDESETQPEETGDMDYEQELTAMSEKGY